MNLPYVEEIPKAVMMVIVFLVMDVMSYVNSKDVEMANLISTDQMISSDQVMMKNVTIEITLLEMDVVQRVE
jgi:hypothetical protein